MNDQRQTSNGMDQAPYTPSQTTPVSPAPEKSSAGPIVGTIIVIVLLALGALYFWGARLNRETPDELPFIPGDDSAAESWVPPSSNSDEAAAIEAELEATNMSEFEQQMDADLSAIESSL